MSLTEGRKAITASVVDELNRHTSREERSELAKAGFVRVDGLPLYGIDGKQTVIIGASLRASELGRHDANNGKMVIVTLSGEVWLSSVIDRWYPVENLLRWHCPRGEGVWVPASNGEKFCERHLWRRFANPDWMPTNNDM